MTAVRSQPAPIHPSRSRTALVVSAHGQVRDDWARYFEGLGIRTLRCAGPEAACALLAGDASCALHEQADFAIYDNASVTPPLMLRLIRSPGSLSIAFAEDRISDECGHTPVITSLASDARDRGCIGLRSDRLGR